MIHRTGVVRLAALATFVLATCSWAIAEVTTVAVPAGTRLQFHLLAPVASDESRTGDPFRFALLAPITIDGVTIAAEGDVGMGTLVLAGHAGSSGHEGDLTLRLDTLRTSDGRVITFADQRFEKNGTNQKIQSGVLGFVPIIGFGARFIRGKEIRIEPAMPIETVLIRPATVGSALPAPSPSP